MTCYYGLALAVGFWAGTFFTLLLAYIVLEADRFSLKRILRDNPELQTKVFTHIDNILDEFELMNKDLIVSKFAKRRINTYNSILYYLKRKRLN